MYQDIIKERTLTVAAKSNGVAYEVGLYRGDQFDEESLKAANLQGATRLRVLDEDDDIEPGEERNHLEFTLVSAEVKQGSKKSAKNVGAGLTLRNPLLQPQEDGFIVGEGSTAFPYTKYSSTVYYHNNFPIWHENFKIALKTHAHTRDLHLHVELVHESSNGKCDLFSFSYLPLAPELLKKGEHTYELPVYKYSKKNHSLMNGYLEYDDAMKASRQTGERCTIKVRLNSTKISQNPLITTILNWNNYTVSEVLQALLSVVTIPRAQLIFYHKRLLESFFEMLESSTDEFHLETKKLPRKRGQEEDEKAESAVGDDFHYSPKGQHCPPSGQQLLVSNIGLLISTLPNSLKHLEREIAAKAEAQTLQARNKARGPIEENNSFVPRNQAIADSAQLVHKAASVTKVHPGTVNTTSKAALVRSNNWKNVIDHFVEHFSLLKAHYTLLHSIVTAFAWATSCEAVTLCDQSARMRNFAYINLIRTVNGLTRLWGMLFNSFRKDVASDIPSITPKKFKTPLLTLLGSVGSVLTGQIDFASAYPHRSTPMVDSGWSDTESVHGDTEMDRGSVALETVGTGLSKSWFLVNKRYKTWMIPIINSIIHDLPSMIKKTEATVCSLRVLSSNQLAGEICHQIINRINISDPLTAESLSWLLRALLHQGFFNLKTGYRHYLMNSVTVALTKIVPFLNSKNASLDEESVLSAQVCVMILMRDLIEFFDGRVAFPSNGKFHPDTRFGPSEKEKDAEMVDQLYTCLVDQISAVSTWLCDAKTRLEQRVCYEPVEKKELHEANRFHTCTVLMILLLSPSVYTTARAETLWLNRETEDSIDGVLDGVWSLVHTTGFEDPWIMLRCKELNAVSHFLRNSETVFQKFCTKEGTCPVLLKFFKIAVVYLANDDVNVEVASVEDRKNMLTRLQTDTRKEVATVARDMWQLCQHYQEEMGNELLLLLLHVTQTPVAAVTTIACNMVFDLLLKEVKHRNSLDVNLSYTIDAVGEVLRKCDTDGDISRMSGYIDFFTTSLPPLFAQHPEVEQQGLKFIKEVEFLSQNLMQYAQIPQEPNYENQRVLACLNAIKILRLRDKPKVMATYLMYLREIHRTMGNYMEEGNVLLTYQEMFNWTNKQIAVIDDGSEFTQKNEMHRKLAVRKAAREAFDKCQMWELSREVSKQSVIGLESMLEFQLIQEELQYQHTYLNNILMSDRLYPAYYRVYLCGAGFSKDERDKEFVYKSGEGIHPEGVRAFSERMKRKYPGATIVNSSDPISEEQTSKKDALFVQITTLTPSSVEEVNKKPTKFAYLEDITPRVHEFIENINVNVFFYTRVHSKNPDKNANEFRDLYIMKTYLITENSLPCMQRCVEVKEKKNVLITPVESAVNNIVSKNIELHRLCIKVETITDRAAVTKLIHGPLSMNLSGVIDAAVQGGIAKYKEAFFDGTYLEANPSHANAVVDFKKALAKQLQIVARGLKLFREGCAENLTPLGEHLQEMFDRMNDSLKVPLSSRP